MMKSTIELSVDDLTQLVQAVAEYNGVNVSSVVFMKDGAPVVPDVVVLTSEVPGFSVRVAKEESCDTLADRLAKVRQSYGLDGFFPAANGHSAAGQ